MSSPSSLLYAIDFGTSHSLLCAARENKVYGPIPLDPFAQDQRVLRSVICFVSQSDYFFGKQAIQEYSQDFSGRRLFRSFKRFLPDRGFQGTTIGNKRWKLEEWIAIFLRRLRETANAYFQENVTPVVLGRPALFSEDPALDARAHSRLESAARLAGFKSIDFLPEPIPAAYRYRLELEKEEGVLIGDFGGGTSDFIVIKPF